MKKILKSKKGVTLVALVVTVIILLILAAITINLTIGENGIITTAKQAGKNYQEAAENEQAMLAEFWSETEGTISSATGSTTSQGSTITISAEDLNKIIAELKDAEDRIYKLENGMTETKESTNPAGTVIAYMGNTAPTGYLFCNGATYNISDYPDLAEQIKNEFGKYNYYGGDGTTTFAVPDLRGEFLRGTGTATRNTGSGASVGVHQDATLLPHYWLRAYNIGMYVTQLNSTNGYVNADVSRADYVQGTVAYWIQTSSSSMVTGTNSAASFYAYFTTRPTNTSVLYCIKY